MKNKENGEAKKRFDLKRYKTPIIICSIVVVALIITAVVMNAVSSGGTVNVYSASNVIMTDTWISSNESYGPVSADRMQTVYVTDTQRVTEVFVTEGQEVKEGDKLLTYDTTLTTIQLEKAALALNNKRLQLEQLKAQLEQAYSLVPSAPVTPVDPSTVDKGTVFTGFLANGGSGTSTVPYVYSVSSDFTGFDTAFVAAMLADKPEAWVAFQTREGNLSKGEVLTSMGIRFIRSGASYTVIPFEAGGVIGDSENVVVTSTDIGGGGSGLSAGEIAAMRNALKKQIRDLELEVLIDEVSYKQMEHEVDDGVVYAQVDGVIVNLTDYDTARTQGTPMLKLSGGGGYYITGSIGELSLDELQIGDSVTVNSWETGGYYTGTVVEKSDVPVSSDEGGYYSNGNNNISFYPYTVFVDGSADLEENMYVSLSFTPTSDTNARYLQNAYLITEGGKSYVWVEENGKLVKRQVRTGASLWGSYVQIISGLTEEDWVAFPYGREVKEGATTKQCDISELYNSMY